MNSHPVGGPVTFLNKVLFIAAAVLLAALPSFSQVDSVIAQLSNSGFESFGGSVSGDGRFVVFESSGDIATVNPRNSDHNKEIFLLDYAQRRIFQITNTKSVYYDDKITSETQANIRVEITNSRPQISNDGRWIVFGSNATSSRPNTPDASNPGSFDGNAFTTPTPVPAAPTPTPSPTASPGPTPTPGANALTQDGNMEMWLYHVPAPPAVADLSLGDEQPLTDLSTGAFTRLTNTDPSQLPRAGSAINGPVVADDNHDASINDDGNAVAFVSNRDLVPAVGNPFPTDDNDEIFTYVQTTAALQQVTKTPRDTDPGNPIYNKNPTISGNGLRVAFSSTGDNPVVGMSGGNNPKASRNEEIYYADLSAGGAPIFGKQVTTTTPTNPGAVVNILDYGHRMSRDGRFIAFDSTANLVAGGANAAGYALFVYDITANTFLQVGPRSDADTAATGGDVNHYPGFTDYVGGVPQTLVFETRENIKADGTVPATASDGLNPDVTRPAQLYSYQLSQPAATAKFTRLANFPPATAIVGEAQPLTSNTLTRTAFTLAATELGTGNPDLASEVYYLVKPTVTSEVTPVNSYFTGASHLPIANATPAATPVPSPSPTPATPANVLGMSPGMLATLDYTATDTPITARTAVGDLTRSPMLPAELSGVTLTINGAACLLKSVSGRHVDFMVPEGLTAATDGSKSYPFVLINKGVVMRGTMVIVPARPDIFRLDNVAAPGGRTKAFNITSFVHTQEPFEIRTVKIKGGVFVPSVIRVYVTGVDGLAPSTITVRIKDQNLVPSNIVEIEPGVWGLDVTLTPALLGAGESQVVVTVTLTNGTFTSRLDDTTSFTHIL